MDFFDSKTDGTYCEDLALESLAQEVGTPAYIYSKGALTQRCDELIKAFQGYPTLPCFAVKANTTKGVLSEIFSKGFGADVVSGGELERAIRAGAKPENIVFSGVGKTEAEMDQGLKAGILSFNVESEYELELLLERAQKMGVDARFGLRINPNIDPKTNPYISTGLHSTKFGLSEESALKLLDQFGKAPRAKLVGLSCHIGSQITELGPFRETVERMVNLAKRCQDQGYPLEFLDLGGGLGIKYDNESPPSMAAYAETLIEQVKSTGLRLVIEPGRSVVGNIGVLLTRVLGIKQTAKKRFAIVDAAMNDLIRPSLYKAYHDIQRDKPLADGEQKLTYDVVGPICETGDFIGLDRELPELKRGDLLVVRGAGAYSAVMAFNYNSRPRAPEIMVSGSEAKTIRVREKLEQIWELEQ